MESFFAPAPERTLKGLFICGSDSVADNLAVNALFLRTIFTISKARPYRLRADTWRRRLRAGLATFLLAALVQPWASASSMHDHERARAAVEAGQVMPLPALLERLQRTHPGQVLELELELEGGQWIYEVKLLQADGQLLKLELDAASAQVLQVKRRRPPSPLKEAPK